MLTGMAFGYQRGNLLIKPGYRGWEPDEYMQDDWRINRGLTLNLGVRYEISTAFTEAHNRYANFDYPTLEQSKRLFSSSLMFWKGGTNIDLTENTSVRFGNRCDFIGVVSGSSTRFFNALPF